MILKTKAKEKKWNLGSEKDSLYLDFQGQSPGRGGRWFSLYF